MLAFNVMLWAGISVLAATGVAAVVAAWAGSPRRVFTGRCAVVGACGHTCARCGYTLDGLEQERCPECGRTFAQAERRRETRRRFAAAGLGCVLLMGAMIGTRVPDMRRYGVLAGVPTRALTGTLEWLPGAPTDVYAELERRAMFLHAGSRERRALADGCVSVLASRRDTPARRCAARLLTEVSNETPAAAEAAAECLRDADVTVRASGAKGVARAKMDRARALRMLSRVAVADESPIVRRAAIHGASMIGCDRVDVMETLAGALNDPSAMVRERALYALAGATARCPRAERMITLRLRDHNESVREAAIWAVGRAADRERGGNGWVKWVAEALWDTSPSVRASAASSLRDLGSAAEPALARLATMIVQEDDEGVRMAARQAVEAINPGTPRTRPG